MIAKRFGTAACLRVPGLIVYSVVSQLRGTIVARQVGQSPEGQSPEDDAEAGRHVTHRIEGSIVRHDVDAVAGPCLAEPEAGCHGDPEIAPVLDADGRRAVEQPSTMAREQASGLGADASCRRR